MARRTPKSRPAGDDRRTDALRMLPSLDECIRAASELPSLTDCGRGYVKVMVQRAQAAMRTAIGACEFEAQSPVTRLNLAPTALEDEVRVQAAGYEFIRVDSRSGLKSKRGRHEYPDSVLRRGGEERGACQGREEKKKACFHFEANGGNDVLTVTPVNGNARQLELQPCRHYKTSQTSTVAHSRFQ